MSVPARRIRPSAAVGLTVIAVVVPVSLAVVAGSTTPVHEIRLSAGSAWLASPDRGYLSLIDGPSEQIVATVAISVEAQGISVTQRGEDAFVVAAADATVTLVDGATYTAGAPVRFGGAGSALSVLAGDAAAYVIDGATRIAAVVDAQTLHPIRTMTLTARPGPRQASIDADGRLWLVDADGSGMTWFDPDGTRGGTPTSPTTELVSVAGGIAVLDPGRTEPGVGWLEADGSTQPWSCPLPSRAGDDLELLGSDDARRIYAAVGQTGTLVVAAADAADPQCGMAITVAAPGAQFGGLVESGHFVFVPDRSTGSAVVVDLDAGAVATTIPLTDPGNDLELVSKDGVVFYNDRSTEKAGVLHVGPSGTWVAGQALQKYDPDTGEPLAPQASAVELAGSTPPPRSSVTDSGAASPTTPPAEAAGVSPPPLPLPATTAPSTARSTPLPSRNPTGPARTSPTRTVPSRTTAVPTPPVQTTSIPTTPVPTAAAPTAPAPTTPAPTTPVPTGSSTSSTTPTPTPPPTVTGIRVEDGAPLSDHSSSAFVADVEMPGGDWHWTATTNIGPLPPADFPDDRPFPVELEGGVTTVTVTLRVGTSEPYSETFPVQRRVPTAAVVDFAEYMMWSGATLDVSVNIEKLDGVAGIPTGPVTLLLNGSAVRNGEMPADGSYLVFDDIPVTDLGTNSFSAVYGGNGSFQSATSPDKGVEVVAVPVVSDVRCDQVSLRAVAHLNRSLGGSTDFRLGIQVFDENGVSVDTGVMNPDWGASPSGTDFSFEIIAALDNSGGDLSAVEISVTDHTVQLPDPAEVDAVRFPLVVTSGLCA